jgi:hypothetical protein
VTDPSLWDGSERRAGNPPRMRFGPFVLDWTVTIPDLIAIVGSITAIVMAYSALAGRIEIHDVRINQHDKDIVDLRRADELTRAEIRTDLKEIKDRLDRLIERMQK